MVIENDKVNFYDASSIRGLFTHEKTKKIKEKFGSDFATIVIGPAGERKSLISGIFSDFRTFGRGGGGAVMGSKNLLGIAIKGNKKIGVYNPDEFQNAVWISNRFLRMNTATARLKERGTANIVDLINAAGGLPTKNFSLGQFDKFQDMDSLIRNFWKKSRACFNCPISCTKISNPRNNIEVDGPEYETIFALGSNCMNSDLNSIAYANYLCDIYGIDTISTGVIISYIMELFEKGYIKSSDLDGIEPKWGDSNAIINLVEKMCKGEGCGKFLETGVKRISENFPETKPFSMHSKGLELPGYLPNAAKGIGLAYAVSERGACHLKGAPLNELLGGADPLKVEGKAALFKSNQLEVTIIHTAILCFFIKPAFGLKEIFLMINSATGFEYNSPRDLESIAERIITLSRIFNIREGLTRKDDSLPQRCTEEPLISGPAKGHTLPLERLLDEYYELMGWDKDGVPKESWEDCLGLKPNTQIRTY